MVKTIKLQGKTKLKVDLDYYTVAMSNIPHEYTMDTGDYIKKYVPGRVCIKITENK